MLSEKTVELNLTAELLAALESATGDHYYAVGLTQVEESYKAFDAALKSPRGSLLVQFKRAIRTRDYLRWDLNQTSKRDQHARLQRLERRGLVVYYALPLYWLQADLRPSSPSLSQRTAFFRPSEINPHGGSSGSHHIRRMHNPEEWIVHSRKGVVLKAPEDLASVIGNVLGEKAVPRVEADHPFEGIPEPEERVEWRAGQVMLMPGERVETRGRTEL